MSAPGNLRAPLYYMLYMPLGSSEAALAFNSPTPHVFFCISENVKIFKIR